MKEMPGYMTYREVSIMFSLMSDADAAAAIKATASYFLYGEIPENLSKQAQAIFDTQRKTIDRDRNVYERRVEAGRDAANARWGRDR